MKTPDPTRLHPFLPLFSFDGWHGEHLTAPDTDFTASWASMADDLAAEYEAEGKTPEANRQKEEALWWRGLEYRPGLDGQSTEIHISLEAKKNVDALLARAKQSEQAAQDLLLLADRLLSGLNALAASGNEPAARYLFTALFRAVDDFNLLAFHKPDTFIPTARDAAGLPGIISSNGEKVRHNETLFERLQVAQNNPVSVYAKNAANPKLSTAANSWALRVINHIDRAKVILRTLIQPAPLEASYALPEWSSAAMLLQPFSRKNWEDWFKVGWRIIMEATGNKPEGQPDLFELGKAGMDKKPKFCVRVGERTQQSNVRAEINKKLKKAFRDLAREK